MCMWEWATFGSQPWLTWCISCSVLHAVMMMPRPSLVLGLLTTFLLFFLPDPGQPWAAKHFIITINYLVPWWIQSPVPSLINSLPGSPTHHCDWLLWIVLKTPLDHGHQWCTPELLIVKFWTFFFFKHFLFNITFAVKQTCWLCFVRALALVWWAVGLQHVPFLCIHALGSLWLR